MVANAQKKWTVEEYLAFERSSEERHEYWDGLVFPVGHPPTTSTKGVGRRHSLIVSNLISSLGNQLINSPCEAYAIGMRVKVTPINYTYPDVSIVYDTPQFVNDEDNTLLNPTVIIEVLAPSSELADRGKKFDAYRTLESMQEYVLVEQHEASITHYTRQAEDSWLLSYTTTLESVIQLPSINCTLLLADIYRKVTFES